MVKYNFKCHVIVLLCDCGMALHATPSHPFSKGSPRGTIYFLLRYDYDLIYSYIFGHSYFVKQTLNITEHDQLICERVQDEHIFLL